MKKRKLSSNLDLENVFKYVTLSTPGVNLSTGVMLWYEYPSAADYSYVNPFQAIGGDQETNPDVCVAGLVSTPSCLQGLRFSSTASHCYSLPVTTVVRKLQPSYTALAPSALARFQRGRQRGLSKQ